MQLHFPLNPTTGVEEPTQLPWTNGVPSTGQEGSYPPFALMTDAQTELVNLLTLAGLTPSDSDMNQVTRAVRGGQLDFAIDVGTADALVAKISLAHTAIKAGLPFAIIKGASANATTTPTLTIEDTSGNNGLTATIVKNNGSAVAIGDLPANSLLVFRAISPTKIALVSLLAASDILLTVLANGPTIVQAIPSSLDGGVRLSVASATSLVMNRAYGEYLIINGMPQLVPAGGVSIGNGALDSATGAALVTVRAYYVYAWMNGTAMTLDISSASPTTNSLGQQVKTGDPTRRLVALTMLNSSGQFQDADNFRGVLNYFNRRNIESAGNVTSGQSTSSSSAVDLTANAYVQMLTWGDEGTYITVIGNGYSSAANSALFAACGVDGSAIGNAPGTVPNGANAPTVVDAAFLGILTEGHHLLSPFGGSNGSATASFTMNIRALTRG